MSTQNMWYIEHGLHNGAINYTDKFTTKDNIIALFFHSINQVKA
jgi:hypothetical protein